MNDKENGGISLPMVISLIKKLGGDGSGVGGEYLPLSGGTMKGDITFNNNLNINMKTIAGVPKSLMNLSDEDKFIFGNQDVIAHLYSEHRPYIHVDGTTQQMAYLSDVLPKAEIQVLEELPLVGETNVMYFVKDNVESVYAIFLWDSAKRIFTLAGDSNMVLDDYYNRTQVDELFLAKAGGYMTGEIDMANEVGIIGFTPSGTKRSLIKLNSLSQADIGDAQGDVIIRSKQPPTWNNGVSNHNFITSNGGLLTNRLTLANNISLMGRDAKGQEVSLIKINAQDEIVIGSDTNWLKLSANSAPLWSGTAQDTPLATETYIADNYLPLAGGAMRGNIVFDNNVGINGINKTGVTKRVLTLNNNDNIILGDASVSLQLSTSTRPKINVLGGTQQELAYLSDISGGGVGDYLPLTGGNLSGNIVFDNTKGIYSKTKEGQPKTLFALDTNNNVQIGDQGLQAIIKSSEVPQFYNGSHYAKLLTEGGGEVQSNFIMANDMGIQGKTSSGDIHDLIKMSLDNKVSLGNTTDVLAINSKEVPTWAGGNGVKTFAMTDDIPSTNGLLSRSGGEMNGNITFKTGMLYGTSNDGETIPLVGVSSGVNVNVGGSNRPLMLQSSQRPSWNNADSIQELSTLQDIDTKVGKDYRVISETLEINGVVSTIATFDAPDIAQALANIQNYEITFNYTYVSSDGKLIIENHLGTSDNNELMQVELDIPSAKNAINIKAHALGSAISITNFVITCHIRPLNLDM